MLSMKILPSEDGTACETFSFQPDPAFASATDVLSVELCVYRTSIYAFCVIEGKMQLEAIGRFTEGNFLRSISHYTIATVLRKGRMTTKRVTR